MGGKEYFLTQDGTGYVSNVPLLDNNVEIISENINLNIAIETDTSEHLL